MRRSSPSCAGEGSHGLRIRGLIVVLWPAGLRISEALAVFATVIGKLS